MMHTSQSGKKNHIHSESTTRIKTRQIKKMTKKKKMKKKEARSMRNTKPSEIIRKRWVNIASIRNFAGAGLDMCLMTAYFCDSGNKSRKLSPQRGSDENRPASHAA